MSTPAHIDFETYSEAGYVWGGEKWQSLPNAAQGKKGLPVVGAAIYAAHPSTTVLCLVYSIDGRLVRWVAGQLPPVDLFLHIRSGGLIESWNVAFERWIWLEVCHKRMGWPELPTAQLRCAMAKARAYSLPGALGNTGAVLGLSIQKDKGGKRLLDKFSMPRNPTLSDPRIRIQTSEDAVDAEALYRYCEIDVLSETEASRRIPDLEGEELRYWQADQSINWRGVQIDLPAVNDCCEIIGQAQEKYNTELFTLTNGAVARASELAKLKAWAGLDGSLDEDGIDAILKVPTLLPWVRRALEIRQAVGSASVKKAYAMRNRATTAGRIHDLFIYHGARTGRCTGEGPQPTNLPNSGPEVWVCGDCHGYFGAAHSGCPHCGAARAGKSEEWSSRAAEYALSLIRHRSLELLEYVFGDALSVVSGCLRALFIAKDGHDLICSDYSAIEAVVLAELAGESWRQEVFRTHGMIYEVSASKISGVPLQSFVDHLAESGKHHPLRKQGKVAELACFAAETEVLTDRGYVRMVEVRLTDKLWDGIEWVHHKGMVLRGKKETILLDGVRVTPEHPISLGIFWKEAKKLVSSRSILFRALETGSASLPWSVKKCKLTKDLSIFTSNALADVPLTSFTTLVLLKASLLGVISALKRRQGGGLKCTGDTKIFLPIRCTALDYLIVSQQQYNAVITQKPGSIKTTGGAASMCMMNGGKTGEVFYRILSLWKAGIIPFLIWTESMWMGATHRGIFVLSPDQKIQKINVPFPPCNDEFSNLRDVYDIADAGPRSRFTIKTNSGHLIVHNSGFGGGVQAWKRFGADEHFSDDSAIQKAVYAWREASPAIPKFWRGVESAAISAVLSAGSEFEYRGHRFVLENTALRIYLLSGRALTYHQPRLLPGERGGHRLIYSGWNSNPTMGPMGWVTMDTWGGKLTENIVQATARDILRHATINLEDRGYPIVLHVYDEIIAEVPCGSGSIAEFESIMMEVPKWANGWPIRATGGWRGKRYRK